MEGLTFPTPNLTPLFQGAGVVITALMAYWVVRKLIKLANKS